MKLVQLLAKELKEWPEGVTHLTQSEVDNEIYNALEGNSEGALDSLDHRFDTSSRHSERPYPIVSREQWHAEREKMNKPKWIRHRGGKCPVADDVKVLYRMRSGTITSRGEPSSILSWDHSKSGADIMAYRIIEETKDQEIEEVETIDTDKAPTIEYAFGDKDSDPKDLDWKQLGTLTYKLEIDATEATKEIDSLVAKWGQIESPLKWRDAIIHCQAIIEDCEREIQRNVNLLDAEGLMMQKDSKKAMQHYQTDIDMSDWRNWQADDIVRVVISNDESLPIGNEYVVKEIESSEYEDGMPVAVFMIGDSGDYIWPEDIEYQGRQVFEFIRRP